MIFNKNTIQEKPPDCSKQNKKNKKNLKEFATRGTSKQAINNQSNPTLNKLSGTDAKSTKHKSERESPSKLQTLSKVEFLNVDYLSKKSKQHKDIEKVVVDVDNDIPFKQVRSKRKKLSKSADKIENVIEPNKEKPPTNNTSSSCEQKSETLNIHKSRSLPSFPKSTERRANTKRAEKEDSKAELLQFNYTKSSQGVKPTIKDSLKLNEPKLLNHKHTSIDNSHHKLESNFKDLTSKTPQLKDQLEKKSITVNPSKFAQAERSEPIVGNKQNSHNQQIVKRASPEVSSSVLNIEINKPHLLNKEVQVNKINKSTVDQDSSKVRQIEISKKELLINEQTGNKSTYENSFKVTKNKGTKDCSIEFSNDQQLKTKKLTDTETIKSEVDSKGFKSNQEEINKEVKPESASLQKQFITKKQVSISNEPLEVVKQSKLRKVQSETAIIVKKLPDQYTQNNSVQKEEKATGQEVKPKIDFNKEIKQIDNIVEKERENILGLNLELNNKPVYAAAIAEQKTNKTTIDQDNTESRQHKQEKNKLKSDIGYLVKQIDSKYSFNTEEFTKQQNLLPDAQEQIFKSHNNDVFKKENLSVLPDSARNLNITTESFADTIEIEPVKRVEQSKIITKTVDNFPASEIIEHFKLKHKGPIVPNLKGVLLESPTGVTPIFNSNTSTLVSKAIKSPITNSLASLNPKPSVEDKNLLSISPIIAQDYTTMKINTQVRVLSLNDNEHQESTLYRIEKNWIIQFRLGSSLLGRKVCLYCNYPEQKNVIHTEFDRNKYYLLPWNQDAGCCNSDDTALFAELSVKIAGNFHYYFLYENATESGPQGSGFFLVDPVLQYGNQEKLPLNGIQCQTVLSKCLGPLSTWENKLRVSKESGYNMIHFTPIQELGKSNSAYSLSGQLKLNPTFNENGTSVSFEDIDKLISKMRKDWKVLSICDIVLNHTANETDWLQEHPEGTYNCFTCPYMRPAYLLDAALNKFSEDVKNGFYESMGIPPEVSSEDHLNSIRYSVNTKVLKEINIPEMYICDVNKLVSQFQELCRKQPPATPATIRKTDEKLKLIQDPTYSRFSSTVDMNLAIKLFNIYRQDSFDEEARIKRCSEQFKNHLDGLNNDITNEINGHLSAALENVIAGIRYFRVQHDGPRIKEISINNPLCSRYFTDYGEPKTMKEYEAIMYSTNSKYLMAHNGWVMNSDPMRNFADADSNIYIRRELIAWGDSVKLRYGDKPEDCPFLWNHMKNYVELTAKIFDGVRLDNCHSTPIPVAVYLLDCARRVRPDLYVVAELFTNSDNTDNIFVNRLGITSLIREAMSAWDPHEEGRLVYRYGGDPVGAFFQPHTRPLAPSIAHALFLDLTHDNPSPIEKRSVFDLLPSSALVNMACCASGSNRGYDELVNHHIHVVDETRQYTEWTNDADVALESPHYVSYNSGIISAKKCINELHFKLGVEGFSQVYVDQIDPNIVAVTRHCPQTHESVILVAFTAFSQPNINEANYQRGIKPLRVEGVLDEIILEATLSHVNTGKGGSKYAHHEKFVQDQKWINGLGEYRADVKKHIQLNDSDVFEEGNSGDPNITQLNFKNFKPGSVVAIRVSLQKHVQDSISKLRDMMSALSRKNNTDLLNIVNKLNLADLNRALYRCDQEERDEGNGFSTYNIPNFGSLVYCGLQGFISLLSTIRLENDLGHPMCGNLRDGNWLIDYMCQRLKLDDGTKQLGQWIDKSTEPLKSIPRYLIPSYFDMIVTSLYMVLLEQSYQLMSDFVKNGSTFVKGLCLGSLQFAAIIKSADLPLLSPNLALPRPPTKLNNHGKMVQTCVTLSAGLPHFSTGYMRNWGRDTFIALRGLFILTGRYEDARYHILGYAACLRHGLIPNLLDAGKNSRFNCRDAIWWWLYCIKSYVDEVPDGVKILSDKVSRIFPTDDSPAIEPGIVDQPLCEVIQESLRCHFQGLAFRERNAGRQIDAHMTDKGFNNQIGVHPETGFVFGGNEFNCGTWMDKMGSSDKAGNRGKPATPRDGSAIELIGLSKAVVMWLSRLHEVNQYPYGGVERINKNGDITKWTFNEWSEKIKSNFEQYFWIDTSPSSGEVRPDLVNKRGIYKDSYGATQEWADFQLRCNFPIAMVAAPELFDPKHAWIALQNAEKHLLGPLGMKTLDPDDWAYCGDYNNADDSTNLKTAHGFNYHQGPEWVWPVGYYLRAKLHFASENGELSRTLANVKVILSKHFTELQTSSWRGLPELTNSNGSFCNDSSRTQAWSMSCILEVLHDLQQIELRQHQLKSN